MLTIGCPSCRRLLRLPASLQGQPVQCPGCGQAFAATGDLLARTQRSAPDPPPRPARGGDALEVAGPPPSDRPAEPGEVPCPFCGAFLDPESMRCPHCRRRLTGLGPGPFWVRRDREPHRGPLIQALGVVSLLLSVLAFPLSMFAGGALGVPVGGPVGLLAAGLGAAAWVMSGRDLARMNEGLMDPDGRSRTWAGRQCGILGVVFCLMCGGGCGLLVLSRF